MGKYGVKALILDYGGVISKPQNPQFKEYIQKILRPDEQDFLDVYHDKRGNYDNGQLTGEEYWLEILGHFGLELDKSEIAQIIQEEVKSWTQINEPMMQFIKESRVRLHKLAIISNMTRDTLVYMNKHFQWLELFDELTYSCEIGINKPDARIYEACLNQLENSPQECLFVDDSKVNVLGAQETGMKGIHYRSFDQYLQEINEDFYFING